MTETQETTNSSIALLEHPDSGIFPQLLVNSVDFGAYTVDFYADP
jgi:hypothetical protein